jgi:hypothetical protein
MLTKKSSTCLRKKHFSQRQQNVKLNLLGSINSALSIAMETDSSAVVFGEDVGFGGVFRATSNLRDKFGSMSP